MSVIEEKIPKIIHYVWFGKNPKSKAVKRCIASWERCCPDYKIIEWNETNYNVKKNRYMYEAYKAKKWAFASDFARYDIVYRYGGIYLDTDVELVKSLDNLLDNKMYMGFLENKRVNSGLGFGSVAGNPVIKEILEYYKDRSFYKKNGEMDLTICNKNETAVLIRHGLLQNGKEQQLDWVHVYPKEYFNPDLQRPVENTYAINFFGGSWCTRTHRTRNKKNMWIRRHFSGDTQEKFIDATDRLWNVIERLEDKFVKYFDK